MIPHNSYLAITIANKEADLKRPSIPEYHHTFNFEHLAASRIDTTCPDADCRPIPPSRFFRLLAFLRGRSPKVQPKPLA